MFWLEAQNTGHILIFGLLSLVALFIVRSIKSFRERNHGLSYLVAAILSLLSGILVELIQSGIGRDAEILDVINDGIGILSFLGIYAFFDPALNSFRSNEGRRLTIGIFLTSLLLLLVGTTPIISLAFSYYQRDAAFPKLVDFSERWPLAFITTQDAVLKIVDAPDQWQHSAREQFGRMTLYAGQYPGLAIKEPVSNWSGYSYLSFAIYADTPQPFRLALRINDREHNQQYDDRFNTSFNIVPGKNLFRIPLGEIRSGPAHRELDLHSIDKLVLFAVEPDQTLQFYLGSFHLE